MDYDRNDALLHWLFRQTQGDAWFRPNEEHISSGVALRVNDGTSRSTFTFTLSISSPISIGTNLPEFRVFPYENASLEPFETAVAALNPVVAIKVRSAAVHAALAEMYVYYLTFASPHARPGWRFHLAFLVLLNCLRSVTEAIWGYTSLYRRSPYFHARALIDKHWAYRLMS